MLYYIAFVLLDGMWSALRHAEVLLVCSRFYYVDVFGNPLSEQLTPYRNCLGYL